ncbi:MAG TPA: MFS transporter [Ureibacillus sp.]|nr:MFS transporter [Ureibacillus sp.]
MTQPKLWTKDFIIDAIVNFFIYITYYLLILVMTSYAIEYFGATVSEAGLASGIFIVGALIGRLFAGKSIDRIGRKKVLYGGLLFFLITTLFYFAVTHLFVLFLVRLLSGVGFGIAATATSTIVATLIPDERRGEGTGYYALSTTIASAIGPFLGIMLMEYTSFNLIFLLCVTTLLISFIGVFFLSVPVITLTEEQVRLSKSWKWNQFVEVKALHIAIISLLMGICYASVLSFLTVYTKEINLVAAGSAFFIFYAIAIFVTRLFTGRLFDQLGENYVLYPSFICFAIGLLLMSQVQGAVQLLLAAVFIGAGFGTFMSCAQAICVKVSPKHRIAVATSTFFVFIDGGIGVGPFLLGFLIPNVGYQGMYVTAAILVVVCLGLYYFTHGRKEQRVRKVTVSMD